MKPSIRTYLCDDENKRFFGEGPYRLLCAIEETGSLRGAALSMNMAYTKALRIIKDAESALGFLITVRTTGGKGGGGSQLTENAKQFMLKYEKYKSACTNSAFHLYGEIFEKNHYEKKSTHCKIGCIIMASGLSKRFGSNKLMASFFDKPLIGSVIDTVNNVPFFDEILVLTRSEDVFEYCNLLGVNALIHKLPNRNEAVNLGLKYMINKVPDLDGCMFVLGDQPLLHGKTIEKMCIKFNEDKQLSEQANTIIQACCIQMENATCNYVRTTIGSPILFDKKYFDELLNLPNKKGGNYVVCNHPEYVRYVPVDVPEELMDVDTPDDLEALKKIGCF